MQESPTPPHDDLGAIVRSVALRAFLALLALNALIAIGAIIGVGGDSDTEWKVLGTTALVMAASLAVAGSAAAVAARRLGCLPYASALCALVGIALTIWAIWFQTNRGDQDVFWRFTGVALVVGGAGTYACLIGLPTLRRPWDLAQQAAWAVIGALALWTSVAIIVEEGGPVEPYGIMAVLLATTSIVVGLGARAGRGNDEPPSGSARFAPIVGTLAYLLDRQTDEVVMIRRDARPDDDHFGKVNGLGGKLEPDEDVVAGLRRELREEAEIELTSIALRGTVTWTNFGPKREQWLGFVFLIDAWEGTPPAANDEGTLVRVPRSRLLAACDADPDVRATADLPMWAGDRHFVPLVFDDDPRAFHGTMPYDGDQPVSWTFERI